MPCFCLVYVLLVQLNLASCPFRRMRRSCCMWLGRKSLKLHHSLKARVSYFIMGWCVCVYAYVRMYVEIIVCACASMCICVCVCPIFMQYVRTCVCASVCTCVCASVCTCVCASVRTCVCASVCTCVCASVRTCVCASVRTCVCACFLCSNGVCVYVIDCTQLLYKCNCILCLHSLSPPRREGRIQ